MEFCYNTAMVEIKTDKPILVSKCLTGFPCNYKGQASPNVEVIRLVGEGRAIPVCPEELGGLPTPRDDAEKLGDRIVTRNGEDVTKEYRNGAEKVLEIARENEVTMAVLK